MSIKIPYAILVLNLSYMIIYANYLLQSSEPDALLRTIRWQCCHIIATFGNKLSARLFLMNLIPCFITLVLCV